MTFEEAKSCVREVKTPKGRGFISSVDNDARIVWVTIRSLLGADEGQWFEPGVLSFAEPRFQISGEPPSVASALLHRLWSKAVNAPGYDRAEWKHLQRIVEGE